MEERQFDEFLDKFEEIGNKMTYDMGKLGLASVRQNQDSPNMGGYGKSYVQDNSMYLSHRFSAENVAVQDSTLHDRVDTLIEEMRNSNRTVRVTNLFSDISYPMMNKMDDLLLDQQVFENRLQYNTETYLVAILREIRNMDSGNQTAILHAAHSHIAMFFRNPLWNTMVGALRAIKFVLTPIFSGLRNVLFGKKEATVEQKILGAIKEQTEFMRTGETGGRSLWERFREQGLVGMGVSAVARSTVGRLAVDEDGNRVGGREAAQRRQQLRETGRGHEIPRNLAISIADKLFSKDVVKRRTNQSIGDMGGVPMYYDFEEKDDGVLRLSDDSISPWINAGRENTTSIIDTVRDYFDKLINTITNRVMQEQTQSADDPDMLARSVGLGLFNMKDMMSEMHKDAVVVGSQGMVETMQTSSKQSSNLITESISDDLKKHLRETLRAEDAQKMALESLVDETTDVRKYTKETARETRRHRRQGLLGMIMNGVLGVGKMIVGAIGAIGGILSSILTGVGSLIALMKAGGLMRRAGNFFGRGRGNPSRPNTRPNTRPTARPRVSGGAGLGLLGAGLVAAEIIASDNKAEAATSGAGMLAGGFAGAKAGALAGSVFGPVGTAVGGVGGSIIGSMAGSSLGQSIYGWGSGLFGGKDEPSRELQNQASQASMVPDVSSLIDGARNGGDTVKEKLSGTLQRMSESESLELLKSINGRIMEQVDELKKVRDTVGRNGDKEDQRHNEAMSEQRDQEEQQHPSNLRELLNNRDQYRIEDDGSPSMFSRIGNFFSRSPREEEEPVRNQLRDGEWTAIDAPSRPAPERPEALTHSDWQETIAARRRLGDDAVAGREPTSSRSSIMTPIGQMSEEEMAAFRSAMEPQSNNIINIPEVLGNIDDERRVTNTRNNSNTQTNGIRTIPRQSSSEAEIDPQIQAIESLTQSVRFSHTQEADNNASLTEQTEESNGYLREISRSIQELVRRRPQNIEAPEDNSGLLSGMRNYLSGGSGGNFSVF